MSETPRRTNISFCLFCYYAAQRLSMPGLSVSVHPINMIDSTANEKLLIELEGNMRKISGRRHSIMKQLYEAGNAHIV
jgi:hypothetical protein